MLASPWTAACQACLSITNSWSLFKPMSIKSVMPSNHLSLCCPLHLMPSIFPGIRVFSSKSVLPIRWPKYWSFSLSISSSKEYSSLISFRMDWFDLLAVQGTLKSLLQHHSSELSILWCSAFFIVQLSHPYMTTGKTIASLKLWVDKYFILSCTQTHKLLLNYTLSSILFYYICSFKWCFFLVKMLVTRSCLTVCNPMDCRPPGLYSSPLSVEFSRQDCCSGLPFPSPADLPAPRIALRSPALQADSFPSEPPGAPFTGDSAGKFNNNKNHK